MSYFVALFGVFFSLNVSSVEIKGRLEPLEENISLTEGDFFKFRLTIWPVEYQVDEQMERELKKGRFLDFFKIVKVESIGKSPNNVDVLEVRGVAVLLNVFEKREFYIWTFKEMNIPVEIRLDDIKEHGNKNPRLNFFETAREETSFWRPRNVIILLLGALGVFLVLMRWLTQRRKKQEEILKKRLERKEWKEKFTKAKSREDYEKIYSSRELWLGQAGGEGNSNVLNFFEILNKHQYKKELDADDLNELTIVFDQIRGIWD